MATAAEPAITPARAETVFLLAALGVEEAEAEADEDAEGDTEEETAWEDEEEETGTEEEEVDTAEALAEADSEAEAEAEALEDANGHHHKTKNRTLATNFEPSLCLSLLTTWRGCATVTCLDREKPCKANIWWHA